MLIANSAAILTDAFPADQRGLALGINQVAAIAGQFIGLVAGGVLAAIDWRAVFWVNVPVGIVRNGLGVPDAARQRRAASRSHRLVGQHHVRGRAERDPDRVTTGIKPYGGHAMGWIEPRGDRLDRRRRCAARGVRGDREAGHRADVPARPVPDPRVRRRQRRGADRRGRTRRAAVHSDHLAAGHLAAAARLQLSARRRCGRASTCCR